MKLTERYEEDTKKIKATALQLSWYMRGGVSYEDVLNMSSYEREAITKIIEENLEATKKSGLPFF